MKTVIFLLWLPVLVLSFGFRDHRAIERIEQSQEKPAFACMADSVADGAPYWLALNLCGKLDPAGLERDLP